jgi:hypothetical protein
MTIDEFVELVRRKQSQGEQLVSLTVSLDVFERVRDSVRELTKHETPLPVHRFGAIQINVNKYAATGTLVPLFSDDLPPKFEEKPYGA